MLTNRDQLVLLRPVPHATSLLARAPMLSIFWLRQIQRQSRAIRGREDQEYISMLSSLGRWTWWLILHHIIQIHHRLFFLGSAEERNGQNGVRLLRKRDIGSYPMAHLRPFRVIARGCIRVRKRDNIGHILRRTAARACLIIQLDCWLVLQSTGFNCVPELRLLLLPRHRKG